MQLFTPKWFTIHVDTSFLSRILHSQYNFNLKLREPVFGNNTKWKWSIPLLYMKQFWWFNHPIKEDDLLLLLMCPVLQCTSTNRIYPLSNISHEFTKHFDQSYLIFRGTFGHIYIGLKFLDFPHQFEPTINIIIKHITTV